MESIEKLLSRLRDMDTGNIMAESNALYKPAVNIMAEGNGLYKPDVRHHLIAEEIEREIAERYMELPVDADGVPIHVGDLIEFGKKGERLEVTHFGWTSHGDPTVAYRRPNGTLDCSCIGDECRHVKPRTVEDVLLAFYHDASDADVFCTTKLGEVVSKYADEIKGLL